MKNTNDFQSHETIKIFKLKEPATKIYDIPSKDNKTSNLSKNTYDYSDKKSNYTSDMFRCFDK